MGDAHFNHIILATMAVAPLEFLAIGYSPRLWERNEKTNSSLMGLAGHLALKRRIRVR